MDAPLWIETHQPTIESLPQQQVRDELSRVVDEPMNLILAGPKGAGKTAAVRALAAETHEDPANDLIEINVDDVFSRTKTEIKNDPRFAPFLTGRSRLSKREMINHVLKESAGYAPVTGTYKTILLDNAESIREDFQQALRRIMEQHHRTTQFVITTRQPATLIGPLRSRCFTVPVRAPTHDEIVTVLDKMLDAEGVEYDGDGVEYVAGYASGDLRRAILGAQTTFEEHGEVTMTAAYEALGEVLLTDTVEEMLSAAEDGQFTDARNALDDLLIEDGYSGTEVLSDVLSVARSRYSGQKRAEIHRLAGEVDAELTEGTNDRLHLARLLAELGRNG
ncbi:AAA family ATPase [Halocatena salina]|uniref:Replication factor C small subunit n=1 Tax=Halocatena salina TaxID=2934340 RepID=A0A8T9ZZ66_9EURY|nr:AAA family ATPase [Halocatena salina]UPM42072.1 AAA family ATPase [Halocatena salina]